VGTITYAVNTVNLPALGGPTVVTGGTCANGVAIGGGYRTPRSDTLGFVTGSFPANIPAVGTSGGAAAWSFEVWPDGGGLTEVYTVCLG